MTRVLAKFGKDRHVVGTLSGGSHGVVRLVGTVLCVQWSTVPGRRRLGCNGSRSDLLGEVTVPMQDVVRTVSL